MGDTAPVFRDEAERLFGELDGAVTRMRRDLKHLVQLMHTAQAARLRQRGVPSATSFVLGMQSRLAGIAWEVKRARRLQARLLALLQAESGDGAAGGTSGHGEH